MHLLSIVGARPQFVKVAMIAKALKRYNNSAKPSQQVQHTLVHTGQHYDPKMSGTFFQELRIPEPQHNLGVGSGCHGKQTAMMLERIEQVLLGERPDAVIVYGDTNSTLAGALAAVKLHTPVAHIEAGLRSFNFRMPEEINRVVTDHVSQILLCPTQTAVANLAREGIVEGVFLSGDVMLDAIQQWRDVAKERSTILRELGLETGEYSLLTLHRAENTNCVEQLEEILTSLLPVPHTIVFPVHPRTREFLKAHPELDKLSHRLEESATIRLIEPVSYLDMLSLENNARMILTDSGGVQKEAYFAGVPCLTLRTETEWTETLTDRWNRLIEPSTENIAAVIGEIWNRNGSSPKSKPDLSSFGDGEAAEKIVKALMSCLTGSGEQTV